MTEPTQEQKCADLARAIFPTAVIEPSSGNGVNIRIYDKPNETRSWYDFNPYDSADDSRALVLWLAKQLKEDHFVDLLFEDHFVDLLSAPLPVIADAAWCAIQEPK